MMQNHVCPARDSMSRTIFKLSFIRRGSLTTRRAISIHAPRPITLFYLRFEVESRNFCQPVLADGPLLFFRQLFGDTHDLREHVLKTPLFFRKRNSSGSASGVVTFFHQRIG